jgi:uncharacterized protein
MAAEDLSVKPMPVAPSERIIALDVLRGFSMLGILIMNIQSFSMIQAAYFNPTAYGDLGGLNKAVWICSHIFADQKFMTIFAILYGAGIILITRSAESKGRKPAGLHYRRTCWLLVIGLLHAYLLWYGDILVVYALCALTAFLLRNLSALKLLIIGLLAIAVASGISFLFDWSLPHWPVEAHEEMMKTWKPGIELVEQELSAYRGAWRTQMAHRAPASLIFQTFGFLIWAGWRAGGLMLVGMALFKWEVLTGQRSKRFYCILMGIGLGVGLPVVTTGVIRNFAAEWTLAYSMFLGEQFNYWGSLLVSLGYICAVMLLCKCLSQSRAISLLAGIGRSALSNYLLQTIICTTLFYGHGLGWFGHVSRCQQLLIVVGVWGLQLTATPIWLRFFRFGPFEWIWRSLTYMKIQPMWRSLT